MSMLMCQDEAFIMWFLQIASFYRVKAKLRVAGWHLCERWLLRGCCGYVDMAAGSGLVVWGVAVALGGVFGGLGAGL